MRPLLSLEGVRVTLGSREVLKKIDLEVAAGQVVALLGPNGSGKSTLLAAAAGIGRKDAGTVLVEGDDLDALTRREAARRIAVVPQQTGFMTPFTVMETVLMGRFPSAGRFSRLTAGDRRAAEASLEAVDLSPSARGSSRTSRVARPRGWPSPGPSPGRRRCSCWMNPSAPSTPGTPSPSSASSTGSGGRARVSSWPSTT